MLLNGRRVGNYAFSANFGGGVDLHAIPLAAIERVEVLKDGASALYGSDAIGGVINSSRAASSPAPRFSGATPRPKRAAPTAACHARGGNGTGRSEGFNVLGVLDLRNAERLKGSDRFLDAHLPP